MNRLRIVVVLIGVGAFVALEIWQFQRLARLETQLAELSLGRATIPRGSRVSAEIDLHGAAQKGHRGAPIALVIYSDFQCPYCARFAQDTLPELERRYVETNRVLVAFKHLPLDQIHLEARRLAQTAACAGAQDKFWPMHDLLFRRSPEITGQVLEKIAEDLQLDTRDLLDCVRESRFQVQVQSDAAEAAALGIRGTPASIIGRHRDGRVLQGELVRGARPLKDFVTIIDRVLAEER